MSSVGEESIWPTKVNDHESNHCQQTFWNLICALEAKDCLGTLIVNELKLTIACDHVHDLSKVRSAFEKELRPNSLRRILNREQTIKDVAKVETLVHQHNKWFKKEVSKGLDFGGKAYYNTWFYWDKFVVDSGRFGNTFGGMYKAAKEISRKRTGDSF